MSIKTDAYSYLRISSDQQKVGDGIRRQLEASKKYAESQGYNLVETMQDLGVSAFKGKNVKEGALGVFIAAIDAGSVKQGSVLIVESLDRLSRDSVLNAFAQFTNILNKGVGVVTLTDNQHYTAESVSKNPGQLFISIGVMVRANDESETKSKRIRAAWQRKRDNIDTKILTKVIPAWLKMSGDGKSIEIDEPKAATVRKIFDLSLEGMGHFVIAKHLNENLKQYPPISTSSHWAIGYIAKILNNRSVYGQFQPKQKIDGKQIAVGDVVEDYFPAIITEDKFNLAQSRIKGRSTGAAGRKGDGLSSLFSGLVKCGHCGGSLFMRDKLSKTGSRKYLRCQNSLIGANCTAPAWRYSEFESSFIQFAREISFNDVFAGADSSARTAVLEGQAATAKVSIAELNKAYETLTSRFEDPELSTKLATALMKRSVELEAEIEAEQLALANIKEKIAELQVDNLDAQQKDFLANYDALLKTEDLGKLREIRFSMVGLLKRVVSEIVVHNHFTINPWEADEVVSDKLRNELGLKAEKQFEEYFGKALGVRKYGHSERYFMVKFSNGSSRVVHPYSGVTYMSVSERLAKMRKVD